jgi:AbrB family looped-hinge helix DNA binding protein
MALSIVSAKGRVVIPQELRDKYHIKKGDKVNFVDYGGIISIFPVPDDPIKEAAGSLKGKTSLTKALLDSRKEELELENRFESVRS